MNQRFWWDVVDRGHFYLNLPSPLLVVLNFTFLRYTFPHLRHLNSNHPSLILTLENRGGGAKLLHFLQKSILNSYGCFTLPLSLIFWANTAWSSASSGFSSKFLIAIIANSFTHLNISPFFTNIIIWSDNKIVVLIFLILAESSIETVPEKISSHPIVVKHARKKGKKPTEILLDRSYHHKAILQLENSTKRGRPDIVYHVILSVSSSPLYRNNMIKFFIHTINDYVIEFGERVRPPRAYHRFEGLFEKLFKVGKIQSPFGKLLLEVRKMKFGELVSSLSPDLLIGFSRIGMPKPLKDIIMESLNFEKVAFVVGGFPRGHFSSKILRFLNNLYSIHELGLDSHIVICRLLYELEKVHGISP